MIYALISSGQVVNTIVADQDFVDNVLKDKYDAIVQISNDPGSPGVGWSYDGANFNPPEAE